MTVSPPCPHRVPKPGDYAPRTVSPPRRDTVEAESLRHRVPSVSLDEQLRLVG